MDSELEGLPRSYSEAKQLGVKRFFTGKPCVNGHLAYRLVSSRTCSECHKKSVAADRIARPEQHKEISRRSALKNREVVKVRDRQRYQENIEIEREKRKARRQSNPELFKEYDRRSREKKGRRLHSSISQRIRESLRTSGKAGLRTFDLLGYSKDELMAEIESKFEPGMTWENYGEWELDHKTPFSHFNFETTDDPDFKACWSLENLQPLWMAANRAKGARTMEEYVAHLTTLAANDNAKRKDDKAA